MLAELSKIEMAAFKRINQTLGFDSLDGFMRFISDEKLWIFCALLLIIYAFVKKSQVLRKYLGVLAIAVFVSDMLSFRVLKPLFQRKRPCYQLENVRLVADSCGSEYGFPSNHAANGFAIASSFHYFMRKRWAFGFYLLAIFVGYTRVYLGVHFPFDILFGFVVGYFSGLFAYICFMRIEKILGQSPKV